MAVPAPIFQSIFGQDWGTLPTVFHSHYRNRPFTDDTSACTGIMHVSRSRLAKLLAPLFDFFECLVPLDGDNIPVTVVFRSEPYAPSFILDRVFYPDEPRAFRFCSKMVPQGNGRVIEYMRHGLGWRCRYMWDGTHIRLCHDGYVLKIRNWIFPLPLTPLIGHINASETALSDTTFSMTMTMAHPIWGDIYRYGGTFVMKS